MSEEVNWEEFKANFVLPNIEGVTQELADQVLEEPIYIDIALGNVLIRYDDFQTMADDFYNGDLNDAAFTVVAARGKATESIIGIGAESSISVEPFQEGWDPATKTIYAISDLEAKSITATVGGAMKYFTDFRDMAVELDASVEVCFMILLGNIDAGFDD